MIKPVSYTSCTPRFGILRLGNKEEDLKTKVSTDGDIQNITLYLIPTTPTDTKKLKPLHSSFSDPLHIALKLTRNHKTGEPISLEYYCERGKFEGVKIDLRKLAANNSVNSFEPIYTLKSAEQMRVVLNDIPQEHPFKEWAQEALSVRIGELREAQAKGNLQKNEERLRNLKILRGALRRADELIVPALENPASNSPQLTLLKVSLNNIATIHSKI